MAWQIQGHNLQMCEGDYGVELPVTFNGMVLSSSDLIKITFKNHKNGDEILFIEFINIQDNTVNLVFTEEQSALFPVGSYVYSIDWYQNNTFMCNLIPVASFKVVDKA